MALSRKSLKAFGLSDDQIDSVVEMHAETVDGLKAQISELKETAAKLEVVTKERDELKAAAEKSGDADKKYGDLKAEFDKYKKEIEDGQTRAKIETAYKSLLKSANIADKYIGKIIKVTDLSKAKLDKDGNLEGADDLKKKAAEDWSEFVSKEGAEGARTPTPPENNGGGNPGGQSKAAQIAAKYYSNLYGNKETE